MKIPRYPILPRTEPSKFGSENGYPRDESNSSGTEISAAYAAQVLNAFRALYDVVKAQSVARAVFVTVGGGW